MAGIVGMEVKTYIYHGHHVSFSVARSVYLQCERIRFEPKTS